MRVPIVFAETYDGTVDFVKRAAMPHQGRWITGEKPRPTVRWLDKKPPVARQL